MSWNSISLAARRGARCVVFGGLDPILTLEAGYLFGLLGAVGLWLQNLPWAAPLMLRGGNYLFLMLPYLKVLIHHHLNSFHQEDFAKLYLYNLIVL